MIDYKNAGVNIEAGDKAVNDIKSIVRGTFTENVLSDIGAFAGFFQFPKDEYEKPVLVSSADGVGTKLKLAFANNRHDTIGQCLVNHCVNDILTSGAKPLFFLDYIGTGILEPRHITDIVHGLSISCKNNQCALIGGEMAEMPGFYQKGEYDIAGTIVGVVERSKIINGSKIQKGNLLIGLRSSGLHTNGYSLARAVLEGQLNNQVMVPELGESVPDALLAVHKSYLHSVLPLVEAELLTGISHITGGGIEGNTNRIVPKNHQLSVDWNAWEWLPIFKYIREIGNIETEEMRKVFNLGIGMILVVAPANADKVLKHLESWNESAIIVGKIE